MNIELERILGEMDLPLLRRNADLPGNCRWLLSNMGFRNSRHPKYEKAKQMLKEMYRKQMETPK